MDLNKLSMKFGFWTQLSLRILESGAGISLTAQIRMKLCILSSTALKLKKDMIFLLLVAHINLIITMNIILSNSIILAIIETKNMTALV